MGTRGIASKARRDIRAPREKDLDEPCRERRGHTVQHLQRPSFGGKERLDRSLHLEGGPFPFRKLELAPQSSLSR